MSTTRMCRTPGCGRACPSSEHAFCRDCIGAVLRTGRPPVIEPWQPAWRRNLAAKDMTGQVRAA